MGVARTKKMIEEGNYKRNLEFNPAKVKIDVNQKTSND